VLDLRQPRHRSTLLDLRRSAARLGLICVVEDVGDLWAMERGKIFSGLYHVLGGTLSALDGIGPDELNIAGCCGG
jgi:recombination protein RecR